MPADDGQLRVELAVTGATAEPTAHGAQLVLAQSGRKIAYSRLKVSDANGRELPATIEVVATRQSAADLDRADGGGLRSRRSAALAIPVDDSEAVYPVRIDPTFSDTNWVSLGGVNGVNGVVYAAVVDGSGNLYIGGDFSVVGDEIANRIAKWNGSAWSALGSGMNDAVTALAVSGSDLYVGGDFTTAGGKVSAYAAKANIGLPPLFIVPISTGSGSGQFSFTLAGPAGSNAVIFASTNLQAWTPLVTNSLTGSSLNFTDALATNFTQRFYRAALPP